MGALELFRGQDQAVGAMEVQCFSQVLEGASFSSFNLVLFGFPMGSSRVPLFLGFGCFNCAGCHKCMLFTFRFEGCHTHTHSHGTVAFPGVFKTDGAASGKFAFVSCPRCSPLPVLTSRYPEAMDKCCHTWESGYRQPSRWLIFIVLKEIAR